MDGTHTRLGSHVERIDTITTVEQSIKMGADMVALNIFCGVENEDELLRKLGMAAVACSEWGLPLLGEMIPGFLLDQHYAKAGEKNPEQDNNLTEGIKNSQSDRCRDRRRRY